MSDISELLDHVTGILNNWDDDKNIEALQAFRKYFQLNNRWVCGDCGRVSSGYIAGDSCPVCGRNDVSAKVVNEYVE